MPGSRGCNHRRKPFKSKCPVRGVAITAESHSKINARFEGFAITAESRLKINARFQGFAIATEGGKMKELIQSVLVYLVIVSVLRSLVGNPKFQQYFQFFSGMILIFLLLSPALSLLDEKGEWFSLLEKNILGVDLEEIEEQMEVAQGKFTGVLEKEYAEALEKQVEAAAEQRGVELEGTEVKIEKGKEGYQIVEISGRIAARQEEDGEPAAQPAVAGQKKLYAAEDGSREAKALKKELCRQFLVEKEQVHIWK